MFLSAEDRSVGKENFCAAAGSKLIRRDLLNKTIKSDARPGNGLGPLYFHYDATLAEPLRVGVIGTGDEGSVLLGAVNPKFITVKAIADIRPYNVWRAFNGDHYGAEANKARPGLMSVYGWKSDAEAKKNVKVYAAYQELLAHAKEDGIEAVIIALPLHLHAPAAIAAMKAGLHVMTEKLMGHSVHECKEMARVAAQTNLLLATGHQRHYNILYDNAVAMIGRGLLGDLHHVRAQWHRGNLPGKDSWQQPMPNKAKPDDPQAGKLDKELEDWLTALEKLKQEKSKDADWEKRSKELATHVEQLRAQIADVVDAKKFGYEDMTIKDGDTVVYNRPAVEELIRWRLWDRTGAGLMAELGSHQLDAAGIFVHAMHKAVDPKAEKPHPLCVVAAGNRPLFPPDRDCEDHVFCLFEFPLPGYKAGDPVAGGRKIGVQYASINGNGFEGYGETVFGTDATLLIERECEAMLFKAHEANDTGSKTKVVAKKGKDKKGSPALEVAAGGDPESAAIGLLGTLPADRGYTEELEHWAWCIRHRSPENLPHCHPKIALGDAVIALVSNMAARRGARVDFKKEWFEIDNDATPENVKPDVNRYA
ncbi:MAG: Gfo/Idh/MocA family oxidoreductase [Thermoguttaceae bacterium]